MRRVTLTRQLAASTNDTVRPDVRAWNHSHQTPSLTKVSQSRALHQGLRNSRPEITTKAPRLPLNDSPLWLVEVGALINQTPIIVFFLATYK